MTQRMLRAEVRAPVPSRFDLVTLFVSELSRSVAFYRDLLGIPTPWDGRSDYAEFHHGGVRFALMPRHALAHRIGRSVHGSEATGAFALSIDLPDPCLVDAEFARLVMMGVRAIYAPRDEPWGVRSAMVEDPDGAMIELVAWLAEADPWPLPEPTVRPQR